MIILVYSAYNLATIGESFGAPEYSYWFVRRAFAPVLERFGIVVPITDPKREVNRIHANAAARGEDCVFFSFEPPHKTTLGLNCRTIPVFAWEFDTIPTEIWEDEPRHDWRNVLAASGSAITHSRFSVAAIQAAMGQTFPVWSIPAPVFDEHVQFAAAATPYQPATRFVLSGIVIDSKQLDLDVFSANRSYIDGMEALRRLAVFLEQAHPQTNLHVAGVVYTVIFNPIDGRKNFNDLLGGFLWAFREVADATLILKINYADPVRGLLPVLVDLAKHGSYRCRVIVIHGMLPDEEYARLRDLTSYAVNTSTNEGQCLPLMEFMSAGRPAIAPAHTAMLDYVTPANSFVVRDSVLPAAWPHDSRQMYRTRRHVVSIAALVAAYRESYAVARHDPARYAAMSRAAILAMRQFCSSAVVEQRLAEVLAAPQPFRCTNSRKPADPILNEE